MMLRKFHLFSVRGSSRFCRGFLALALTLALGSTALALEARTVTSLSLETESSSPSDFCRVGETLFFRANDGIHGSELWKIEGPDAKPVMVADIKPGASSSPEELVSMGGRLFFFTDDGANGSQLWTSDGTEEGTSLVKAIFSERMIWNHHLAVAGDRLFFFADDMLNGFQLWTSDGTDAGTVPVTDLHELEPDSIPFRGEICAVGETVYFVADDGTHGFELWQSDGTAGGTAMVADLYPSDPGSTPECLTPAGGSLFFLANDGVNGRQVYGLDGEGPVGVTSFDEHHQAYGLFAGPDGSLFIFSLTSGSSGEVWHLPSGTSSADLGCTLSGDVGDNIRIEPVENIDGGMIFTLLKYHPGPSPQEAEFTSELWSIGADGTGAAKFATLDEPVVTASETSVLLDGQLFFLTESWVNGGISLWRTDGTESGTVPLVSEEEDWFVMGLYAFGDVLFLKVGESRHGSELWVGDGTPDGFLLHTDINRTSEAGLDVWGDRIYFGAWDESGSGLWASDGTAGGTARIAETPPVSGHGPCYFSNGETEMFFFAGGAEEGVRLWASDGTDAGSRQLADVGPENRRFDSALQELNGERYFIRQEAGDRQSGYIPQLWKTNGTVEGTVLVADPAAGFAGMNDCLVRSGNRLFFDVTNLETYEVELWVSDGTPGGTAPVEAELPQGYLPELAVTDSGEVFFALWGRNGEMTLWKSDGTPEGTVQVALLGTDAEVAAADFVPVGDGVFFRVYRYETWEIELWVTEGTEETTHRVADINPEGKDDVGRLTALGDGVVFAANDGIHGRELWSSDGTGEETVMVADINPDGYANPMGLEVLDGRFFFSADDGVHGRELWTSDGTEEGTFMVCDAFPGDSNPQNPVLLGDELYFTAVDGDGDINLMRAVEGGGSGCSTSGLPALGLLLLPLLGLLKR